MKIYNLLTDCTSTPPLLILLELFLILQIFIAHNTLLCLVNLTHCASAEVSGDCLGTQQDHVVVLTSICGKRDSLCCVVTVCSVAAFKNSGNMSRDGEGGCNIRLIIAGAPMVFRVANWTPASPAVREEMGGAWESSVTLRGWVSG